MTQDQQAGNRSGRKPGAPGGVFTVDAAENERPYQPQNPTWSRQGHGHGRLILNTVGRRSGQPRETPVAWFADGEDTRLIVASGGGSQHPDWHTNLMAYPDRP